MITNTSVTTDRPLRVAIWSAVSSKPQAEKTSLSDQEEAGRRFAASLDGHVVAAYVVPGHSRDLIFWTDAEENIPAYRQLREGCERGDFDVLWALDPDRLGRDPALSSQVISLVEKSGAEVYLASAPHPVGQATAGHRYIYAIQSVRAQEDQSLRVKRHRFGTKGRIERGLPANHWPLGYVPIRDPETGQTTGGELDPNLAPAVEQATRLFLAGETYNEIRRRLEASPHRPPIVARWSHSTVYKILHNDTYAGYPSWGEYTAPEKSVRYPALWDEETYSAILRERERRAHDPYAKREGSPLSGVAFCARCGHRMSRHNPRERTSRLRCAKHAQTSVTGEPCHANYLKEEHVIAALGDYLRYLRDNPNAIAQILSNPSNTADQEQRLRQIEDLLTDLDQRRERLALALAAGQMDGPIYRRADDQLLEQVDALGIEHRGLEKRVAATPDLAERRRALTSLAQIFPELIQKAPATRVRALIQKAGLRIECEAGEISFLGLVF